MTKAFDLACFIPANPTVLGDTVVTTQTNPMRTDWQAMVSGGAYVPAATAQGQTLTSGFGPGFAWTAAAPVPGEAPAGGAIYGRTAGSWVQIWSQAQADARYQAADPDLTAIAGLSGSGMLVATGPGAWALQQDLDSGTY